MAHAPFPLPPYEPLPHPFPRAPPLRQVHSRDSVPARAPGQDGCQVRASQGHGVRHRRVRENVTHSPTAPLPALPPSPCLAPNRSTCFCVNKMVVAGILRPMGTARSCSTPPCWRACMPSTQPRCRCVVFIVRLQLAFVGVPQQSWLSSESVPHVPSRASPTPNGVVLLQPEARVALARILAASRLINQVRATTVPWGCHGNTRTSGARGSFVDLLL